MGRMRIARCNFGDRDELQRVHALQRAAYAVEAEMIRCWEIPGLLESPEDLARSAEVFWGCFAAEDGGGGVRCVGIIATEPEAGEPGVVRICRRGGCTSPPRSCSAACSRRRTGGRRWWSTGAGRYNRRMFWSRPLREWWLERGAAARRRHEAWLATALRKPGRYPRIPVRPVVEGGFDPVLATPEGRVWAESWWGSTLESPDLDVERG